MAVVPFKVSGPAADHQAEERLLLVRAGPGVWQALNASLNPCAAAACLFPTKFERRQGTSGGK